MDKKSKIVNREHKEWDKEELNYLKTVGSNIIRVKKEKKLTSKYIYESLDIDKSNYRRIESGRTNVSLLLLRRISKILNVELSELVK